MAESKDKSSEHKKSHEKEPDKEHEGDHDSGPGKVIDSYEYKAKNVPIKVTVVKRKGEFVPLYEVSISSISKTTEFMLERIRQELIKSVNLEMIDITDSKRSKLIESQLRPSGPVYTVLHEAVLGK